MANDDCDLGARAVEDHQKERGALSAGEIFIIKMLQAVSGGALVGALFQTDTLIDLAGIGSFLVFLSAMSLAFVLAVFAAYWKYQCNMYEAKAVAIDSAAERQRWTKKSACNMKAMRAGIRGALLLIAGGFIQLIVCLWVIGLSDQPGSDAEAADRAASVGQSASRHPVYHALNRDFNCSRHNVFAARAAYREVLALIELELYRA